MVLVRGHRKFRKQNSKVKFKNVVHNLPNGLGAWQRLGATVLRTDKKFSYAVGDYLRTTLETANACNTSELQVAMFEVIASFVRTKFRKISNCCIHPTKPFRHWLARCLAKCLTGMPVSYTQASEKIHSVCDVHSVWKENFTREKRNPQSIVSSKPQKR